MTGVAAHASDNILGEVIATRPPLAVDDKTARVSLSLPHTAELQTKNANESFSSLSDDDDGDERFPAPTEEELKTLRKVAANMPLVSFALCWVEFAERASYYGAKAVFSNFIQFPLPAGAYLKVITLELLSNSV